MKDGKFETRAQIWKHLLEGGRIKNENVTGHNFLKDGELYHSDGFRDISAFLFPKEWSIYEEPKPKKKITLYNYTYEDTENIWESGFTTKKFESIGFLSETKLLKTESKEIEVDDV